MQIVLREGHQDFEAVSGFDKVFEGGIIFLENGGKDNDIGSGMWSYAIDVELLDFQLAVGRPVDMEGRDDGPVFWVSSLVCFAPVVAPAFTFRHVHEGGAEEVIRLVIGQVGVGISFVVGEEDESLAEGAGYHERARAERSDRMCCAKLSLIITIREIYICNC